MSPRVTVCIVTYNQERYIHECVMSVLGQMLDAPVEILIGDDISDDGTEAIVRDLAFRFPEVIRYFRHETRLGPAGNYQFLVREARGKYIAHLDGDDYWLPGKLDAQIKCLADDPGCSAIYTNALCINDEGCLLGLFNNILPDRFDFSELFKRGNFLNNSSMMYRAELRDAILSWEPRFIDYRIHLYLARCGTIAYLNAPFVAYRVRSRGSMVVNQNDLVRELYWSAVQGALEQQESRDLCRLATADFLSGILFGARERGSASYFLEWWRRVSKQYRGNLARLAVTVVGVTVRRRWFSLLNKYCGRLGSAPFRILHRR